MASLCGICGASLRNYFRDGQFGYLRCAGCRHVVLDPVPTEAELSTFYTTNSSELWNSGAFAILQDYASNPAVVRQYYWRDRIRHIRREFPDALKPDTVALDVGCSSGVFVATLRDLGLHASGQDIAGPAVEAGAQRLNLRLSSKPITELTGRNDLVTCYDVIEHWPDPVVLVEAIRSICSPGAAIVFRTPNHASWLRTITGKKWLWYIPPAHINLFTPKSLTMLLTRHGFQVRKIRTDASTYVYFVAHYLQLMRGRPGVGSVSLDMPRWRRNLIYGVDGALRIAASPLLIPANVAKAGPLMEVYATV